VDELRDALSTGSRGSSRFPRREICRRETHIARSRVNCHAPSFAQNAAARLAKAHVPGIRSRADHQSPGTSRRAAATAT
jgi:hypothetical protein